MTPAYLLPPDLQAALRSIVKSMADEPRRSNAKDAELVERPACPKCGAANRPWAMPVIELINRDYFCVTCSFSWPVKA
jgi:hypothetical protein